MNTVTWSPMRTKKMEETIAQIKQYLKTLKLQRMENILEEELVHAVK